MINYTGVQSIFLETKGCFYVFYADFVKKIHLKKFYAVHF